MEGYPAKCSWGFGRGWLHRAQEAGATRGRPGGRRNQRRAALACTTHSAAVQPVMRQVEVLYLGAFGGCFVRVLCGGAFGGFFLKHPHKAPPKSSPQKHPDKAPG